MNISTEDSVVTTFKEKMALSKYYLTTALLFILTTSSVFASQYSDETKEVLVHNHRHHTTATYRGSKKNLLRNTLNGPELDDLRLWSRILVNSFDNNSKKNVGKTKKTKTSKSLKKSKSTKVSKSMMSGGSGNSTDFDMSMSYNTSSSIDTGTKKSKKSKKSLKKSNDKKYSLDD